MAGGIKLRGTAAIIKEFGKVLHAIWIIFWNPLDKIHQHVDLCLRTGNRSEEILNQHRSDFVLPGAVHVLLSFKCLMCVLFFLFRFLMCLRLCRLVYRIPFGTQRRCGNRAKNTYVSSFPQLLDASRVGNKRRNATLRTHREGFICKSSSYGALESVGKLPWMPYDLRMCSYSFHVKS